MTVPQKKRPRWLSWLPAIVLVVILVGVGITTATLLRDGLGQPAPQPTEGQVTDLNWSSFTKEGLAYIAKTRQVRIDMSTQPVDATALGLAADDTIVLKQINTGDTTLDYELIINGGGEGAGGGKFTVSTITIATRGGQIASVSAPLSQVVNFRQTLTTLLGKADLWGWDVSDVDSIYDIAKQATQDGVGYQFTFGPSDKAGVPVSATASCDTSGYCQVVYSFTPATGQTG